MRNITNNQEYNFCKTYSPNQYRKALVELGWSEKDASIASKYYAEVVFKPTLQRHRWLFPRKELSDKI